MMKNHNIIHTFFIALFLFSMPLLAKSNQDYIDEYRSEIDQFIKNSDLYNKEISKYKIGVWNDYFYISDTFHDFALLEPTLEGLENVFQLDAHYSIADIKIENFFNNSNLTFIRESGGTGVQVHEKHILYLDNGSVEHFNYTKFTKTTTGSLAFEASYLESLEDNDYPSVMVKKKTDLKSSNGFIYFYDKIQIKSNHLEEYIKSRGYKDVEQFYDLQLGILEFEPILSKIIFKGGGGGGASPFVIVHDCFINQFKPNSIARCVNQTPDSYKYFLDSFALTLPNDKIKTISKEEFFSYAQDILPEELNVFSEDLYFDLQGFKEAFTDYGNDMYYEAFLNIISTKEDLKIVEFRSRMKCGVGGRCLAYILYKKNNNWLKSNCVLSSQGYPYFYFKNQEQDSQKIVTVSWWNETSSCTINK